METSLDMVKKAFNSRMVEVFQGNNLGEIIKKMFTHMTMQVENPVLVNSRILFDRVLFLDIKFHKLKLTRSSSYLPLPDWTLSKKAVINPKNEEDEECFKWGPIMALYHKGIGNNSQQISKLRRFEGKCDWSGLTFPDALDKIKVFKWKNDVSVNVLGLVKEKLSFSESASSMIKGELPNLLLIAGDRKEHCALIKMFRLSQFLS